DGTKSHDAMLQGRAVMTADRVVRDSVQPGEQRLPAIIVCAHPLYSAEKHRRRKVLRDMVVGYPGVYVAIDLRVMAGVDLVPCPRRTLLGARHQFGFVIPSHAQAQGDRGGVVHLITSDAAIVLTLLARIRGRALFTIVS